MSKRNSVVIGMALVALLVAGGLFASNMGFKLNYVMDATGTNGSASGTNNLGLPFNQQTSLVTASDLFADINAANGGTGTARTVSRLIPATDTFETYNGVAAGGNFTLIPGEGLQVQVDQNVNYIVVGSHDPGLVINLDAPGTNGSASGNNLFSVPYHTTTTTLESLFLEVEAAGGPGSVNTVSGFSRATDLQLTYNGVQATNATVPVSPGQSYTIQVNTDVAYVPSHY